MALDVICDVENCAYNHGTKCHANAIKVCTSNNQKANAIGETQCNTFKHK